MMLLRRFVEVAVLLAALYGSLILLVGVVRAVVA